MNALPVGELWYVVSVSERCEGSEITHVAPNRASGLRITRDRHEDVQIDDGRDGENSEQWTAGTAPDCRVQQWAACGQVAETVMSGRVTSVIS